MKRYRPKSSSLFFSRYGKPRIKVDDNGCWIWQQHIAPDGYGKFSAFRDEKGSTGMAHRAFYLRLKGEIPAGFEIHHQCETRACVNPDHLQIVSRADHVKTMPGGPLATKPHYETVRTHCPKGHQYTEENTIIKRRRGRTVRHCRSCNRAYCMEYYFRKKAEKGQQ